MDTAAAIGGRTVCIQLPLSDVSFLTMGFGGRRWPDVVLMVYLPRLFLVSGRESWRSLQRVSAEHFAERWCGGSVAERHCGEAVVWHGRQYCGMGSNLT